MFVKRGCTSVTAEGDVDTSSSGEGSGPPNTVDSGQSEPLDTRPVSTPANDSAVSCPPVSHDSCQTCHVCPMISPRLNNKFAQMS